MLGQREVTQTIECPISLCVDFDGAGLGLLRAGGGTVGAYGQGVAIKPKKVRDEGCGLANYDPPYSEGTLSSRRTSCRGDSSSEKTASVASPSQ